GAELGRSGRQLEELQRIDPVLLERMDTFIRNYWVFFGAQLLLGLVTTVLTNLQALAPAVAITIFQVIIGGSIAPWMLDRLRRFSSLWRVLFIGFACLRIVLGLSGAVINPCWTNIIGLLVGLTWSAYVIIFLTNSAIVAEFHRAGVAE